MDWQAETDGRRDCKLSRETIVRREIRFLSVRTHVDRFTSGHLLRALSMSPFGNGSRVLRKVLRVGDVVRIKATVDVRDIADPGSKTAHR